MLILKEGVQGVNISDLNSMYKENLKGNSETGKLIDAFDWNKTKEGYQFWSFVNGITKVVPEIDKMKEEISVLPEPIHFLVQRELEKTPRNKSKALKFAFKWESSPQGRPYWELVSNLIRMYHSETVKAYQPSTSNGINEYAH